MQFRPSARFVQNSSRFLAWGNCPAMPITAIGSARRGDGALVNLDAVRPRQEVSFSAACLGAILDDGEVRFAGATGISTAGGAPGLDSVPRASACSST